jgi:hypothetical protein
MTLVLIGPSGFDPPLPINVDVTSFLIKHENNRGKKLSFGSGGHQLSVHEKEKQY